MKKQFLWMLTVILTICGAMMNTSCSSDDDDNPEGPATDNVRLTKMVMVTLMANGDTLAVSSQDLIWEDGLLKRINFFMRSMLMGTSLVREDTFVYEGTNCTEIIHGSGTHDYFTYADGRLRTAVSTMSDGTITRLNVNAYTVDGHVSEMTKETIDEGNTTKMRYSLTWEDGDLVSYVKHPIEPAGDDSAPTTFTYYDVPSPFTGYPMAHYILNVDEIAGRGTKHYLKSGKNPKLENGRLVAETMEQTNIYYVYSDGTGSTTAP